MTTQTHSERTGDGDTTRTERRRSTFMPGIWQMPRKIFNAIWITILVLGLFVLAGTDLATWLLDG